MTLLKKLGPLLIFPAAERAAAGHGRPSLRTPETVARICAAIRESGHSDTHAAAQAGVSSSAVSRWRQEDEDFALQLDAARTEYLDGRLQVIRETRRRDGSLDWRAQAWLMQVAAPEVYGTPSRRYSLAREKEEKKRAEEKAPADDPNVLSPADLARYQQWRAYSLHRMNGVGEEEARWLGHFGSGPGAPVFPGSLAIAGAEIAPERELSPEEEAQMASLRERRRVAIKATADREEAERRALARLRGEPVEEDGEGEPADGDATDGGAHERCEPGRSRAELQNEANLPETLGVANATNLPETREAAVDALRGGGTPEDGTDRTDATDGSAPALVEGTAPSVSGASAPIGGATRGSATPSPGLGASPAAEASAHADVAGDDYLIRLLSDYRARNPEPAGEGVSAKNRANIPESPAAGDAPGAAGERLLHQEIGVPRARRPLTGAARAAAEAKEWRRINRLAEEQFERSADRAMAVADAASRDAIPGMWAGF